MLKCWYYFYCSDFKICKNISSVQTLITKLVACSGRMFEKPGDLVACPIVSLEKVKQTHLVSKFSETNRNRHYPPGKHTSFQICFNIYCTEKSLNCYILCIDKYTLRKCMWCRCRSSLVWSCTNHCDISSGRNKKYKLQTQLAFLPFSALTCGPRHQKKRDFERPATMKVYLIYHSAPI